MADALEQQNPHQTAEQSEADKWMLKIIKSREEAFNRYRRSKMTEIKANIAYLCGHQNIMLQGDNIRPLNDQYQTKVVANRILPAVVNDIAVATRTAPIFDVVPAGTDEGDKATALVGQSLIPYLQKLNGKEFKRSSVVLWYDIAGIGWRKVYWDPYYKCAGYDENGIPQFQGEVVVEHIPNTELVFDYRVKDPRKHNWVIHNTSITMSEVKTRFGADFAKTIKAEHVGQTPTREGEFDLTVAGDFASIQQRMGISSRNESPGNSEMLEDDKLVSYSEFWHKCTPSMPTGAYAVRIGEQIAVNEPYPMQDYPHGELPIVPAAPVSIDGAMPSAVSRISQARPLQREYNKLRSIVLDNIDAMGNSVIMVPNGCEINYKRLDNGAGNIIEYDGPAKPTREPGIQIPGTFFAYMAEVKQSIDEVFAFHAPSRGMTIPGGPDSGKGLQLLQEAAHTQFGPIVNGLDKSDEQVVFQMLTLAVRHYQDRLISIMGEDNKWALKKLDPNELNGRISVIVRAGSSLPLNKALETEKTFMIWQSGLLGDPMDPANRMYALKNMDLGNIENILSRNAKQISFAQTEFISAEEMAAKAPEIPEGLDPMDLKSILEQYVFVPFPNDFDDHQVHIMEHTNHYLENHFKYLSTGNPIYLTLDEGMRTHILLHQNIVTQTATNQLNQQVEGQAFIRGNTPDQIILKEVLKAKGDIEKEKAKPKPTSALKSNAGK